MQLGVGEYLIILFIIVVIIASGWVAAALLRLTRSSRARCASCGTALPAGARFCPGCGRKV